MVCCPCRVHGVGVRLSVVVARATFQFVRSHARARGYFLTPLTRAPPQPASCVSYALIPFRVRRHRLDRGPDPRPSPHHSMNRNRTSEVSVSTTRIGVPPARVEVVRPTDPITVTTKPLGRTIRHLFRPRRVPQPTGEVQRFIRRLLHCLFQGAQRPCEGVRWRS